MAGNGDLQGIKRDIETLKAEVEIIKQQLSLLVRERVTPQRLTRLIDRAVKRPN